MPHLLTVTYYPVTQPRLDWLGNGSHNLVILPLNIPALLLWDTSYPNHNSYLWRKKVAFSSQFWSSRTRFWPWLSSGEGPLTWVASWQDGGGRNICTVITAQAEEVGERLGGARSGVHNSLLSRTTQGCWGEDRTLSSPKDFPLGSTS